MQVASYGDEGSLQGVVGSDCHEGPEDEGHVEVAMGATPTDHHTLQVRVAGLFSSWQISNNISDNGFDALGRLLADVEAIGGNPSHIPINARAGRHIVHCAVADETQAWAAASRDVCAVCMRLKDGMTRCMVCRGETATVTSGSQVSTVASIIQCVVKSVHMHQWVMDHFTPDKEPTQGPHPKPILQPHLNEP
jgi:hypothetical protein